MLKRRHTRYGRCPPGSPDIRDLFTGGNGVAPAELQLPYPLQQLGTTQAFAKSITGLFCKENQLARSEPGCDVGERQQRRPGNLGCALRRMPFAQVIFGMDK